MIKALVDADLITGLVGGDGDGVAMPAAFDGVPLDRLRHVGGQIVDVAVRDAFHIDSLGRKRVEQLDPAWPEIACAWDDILIRDDLGWRVELAGDRLAAARDRAKLAIDVAAESARLRFITPGAGQAMVYQAKGQEARAALADPAPTAEAYPLLAASLGIDGETITSVAEAILAIELQWRAVAAQIERARLVAKRDVGDAADVEAVAAIVAAQIWPE